MLPTLELTESDELGYYMKFEHLFTEYAPFFAKRKDHYIEINFSFTDEDTEPIEAQLKAHEILMANANQMMESLLQYLKQDEEYFLDFHGVYNVIEHQPFHIGEKTYNYTSKEGFPLVKEATEFINHFTIDTINISDSDEDNIAFIGFSGSCSWEKEHGFGVAFLGKKLLHVADWDYGRDPSWAQSKDDGKDNFLTKYFTNTHLLENLDERKSRLATESQSIEVENTAPYQEIFNWLVDLKMIYGYRNKPSDLTGKETVVVLNEIKELMFHGNHIDQIPAGIGLLKNLTSLHLSFNMLKNFPLEVTKLIALEQLNVSNNEIAHIPAEISALKNLKSLKLNSNKLASIPAEIGFLTNLKHLDVSSNKLSDLPESFSSFESLEELELDYNQFTNLPDCILGIQNLKDLDISNNKLTTIHESIHKLEHLEALDIRFNEIEKFPESLITKMPNLRRFEISVNQLSLEDLNRLKDLIPEEIDSDIDSAIECVIDELERAEELKNNTEEPEESTKPKTVAKHDKKWWKFWK
jgi:Leucine-rich repeat (LRR) protein